MRTAGRKLGMPDFVARFICWLHACGDGASSALQGAFLVFFPGVAQIEAVHEVLSEMLRQGELTGAILMPMFGQQGAAFQHSIFSRPPSGFRKIILATNIAGGPL